MGPRVRSHCPWFIADEDVNPAESGLFSRDLSLDGQAQRHFGLPVLGQFDPSLSLGMVAIRCERAKGLIVPLALALVDSPPVEARTPMMDLRLLARHPNRWRDDATREADEDDQ
jgi:hypothetical protein